VRIARLALVASMLLGPPASPAGRATGPPDGEHGATPSTTTFCGAAADEVERRIDALLGEMTLAEKTDQMHGAGFSDGMWRTPANPRLGIPGFRMLDGPRGVSSLAGAATSFPVAMARGATWDPALEWRVGEAIGAEARAKGVSVLLAPTLNLLRHPRWGRAQETYGEDPLHLGRMGTAFVRGAQRHVIACAKHFAANSIEDTRLVVDVTMDERTLREVYLPHFRMAVMDGGVGSVMAAYNKLNGQYCAENTHLLHDILKGEWGFRGFVLSDWFMGTRSTWPSAMAGLDLEMPIPVYYGPTLAVGVEGGQIPLAVVDEAVRRLLRAKLCFGLDRDAPVPDPSRVQTPAHLELALEVARTGIVLLENRGGALPLDPVHPGSIAVVGDLATMADLGDLGSSVVSPSFAVTPLDGIRDRARGATVVHVPGPPLSADGRAVIAAADAAVVVAGLAAEDEGEGSLTTGDRLSLGLPSGQDELIAATAALNPRTVVVLEGGSAITMPWAGDVAAILMAWYPGQLGGEAIAEVLFGEVNPSGRLPLAFPRAETDLPPFENLRLRVAYGFLHGYRWLEHEGIAPLFPFGFGRSYTTFGYANLALSATEIAPDGSVRVAVDVTNTGGMAGDEVVQLYVSYRGSRVQRAPKDLRGFARVHLAPGQTATVPLEVRAADLAYWDVDAGAWRVEPIEYGVHVGPSSRELPLEGSFRVVSPPRNPEP
jgi:beta-glucosidase